MCVDINVKILKKLQKQGNVITTNQVQELGFSKTLINIYVKNGLLERVCHGVYVIPGLLYDEMYVLNLQSKKFIFSHETALFSLGMSERTPFKYSVTVPSGFGVAKILKDTCDCYYIAPDLLDLGAVEAKTSFGNNVRCYNLERTVCDILRSRNRLDEEMVTETLKKYANMKNKNLNLLVLYAEQFKVLNLVRQYMGVLL